MDIALNVDFVMKKVPEFQMDSFKGNSFGVIALWFITLDDFFFGIKSLSSITRG